ncbi:MAG: SDR family NAD(P)-dependent oxidoreductase, partial [Actinobacteria bacterium]|nr:SDR family NAD(P)-dependent oxidoreductase [Actinomycetota bacterium]
MVSNDQDPVINSKNIMERFSLRGKTALVTGAGQGIGRALAHGLADAGAYVAVVDLDLDLAEKVASEIKVRNPNVESLAIKTDVTDPDQVTKMVETVVKSWGKLTIGCNNAGIGQWVDTLEMTYSDWQMMIKIDLDSVFLCAQAEARHMVKNNYGKIINTASMSGYIANYPQGQ